MAETPSHVRSAVALIASITALVTALTSLVKATDKSVERVSYEVLSRKIAEMQEYNASMHKDLDAIEMKAAILNATPSASSPTPSPSGGGGATSASTSAPIFPPPFVPSASQARPALPPRSPLPPWKTVKDRAEKREF